MFRCSLISGIVLAVADVVLPIPGRKQWDDRHGYCGSCSLQQAGLFFGNWISQDVVRKSINDHELLPGVNEAKAAKALKFSAEAWNGEDITGKSQYHHFMLWVKAHLLQKHPVVLGFYLSECSDADYDHIMPAIGVRTAHNDTRYHGKDVLIINNNYMKQSISHTFDNFKGTRKSCARTEKKGGCIPEKVDYGVAIRGNLDPNDETFPVQLLVDRWDEPDLVKHERPVNLTGMLLASGLTTGESYLLLRYGDAALVPKSGFASPSSRKAAEKVVKFEAKGTTWTYTDPLGIPSGGSVFYRVVRASPLRSSLLVV